MIGIVLLLIGWYWIGWEINTAGKIEDKAKQLAGKDVYPNTIVRRNLYRRKGEKREKKKKIIGFRE